MLQVPGRPKGRLEGVEGMGRAEAGAEAGAGGGAVAGAGDAGAADAVVVFGVLGRNMGGAAEPAWVW